MKIALDYDKTYTADPGLWDTFIISAFDRDHDLYIVTFRSPDCPIDNSRDPLDLLDVYYTSATPKQEYMEKQGIKIDIWIDDDPELIVYKSDWTDDQRERWKQENGF